MSDEKVRHPDSDLREKVLDLCQHRSWSMQVLARLGSLCAEAAELAEAVRGKGRSTTLSESADVLFTLLALSPHGLPEIVEALRLKITATRDLPPYQGEERE